MKLLYRLSFLFASIFMFYAIVPAQSPPNRPQDVAGIPVNYDEDKVGEYTLPDLLTTLTGKKITTSQQWLKNRRPEIVKLLEENQFGKAPGKPAGLKFVTREANGTAFGGKAIRRQVSIQFAKDRPDLKLELLIYLPANLKKPAPLLLNISFAAPNQTIDDPAIFVGDIWTPDGKKVKADQPSRFGKMNVEQFIDAGFGYATFYYGDVEPDIKDSVTKGIRGYYLKPGQAAVGNSEWGAVAAWAWGMSRIMDYFETDKSIDANRVAIQGASRLGKTVLWTGTNDTRFKMVIASISGESGASISRRNYGETVAHMTHPTRYGYQFAPKYHSFSNAVNRLPVDGHFLVAAIAPRPLLLQTGNTDFWSDPKGEYISVVTAEPVFRLFKQTGPQAKEMPAANDTSLLLNNLGYYMHEGGHSVLPDDWKHFITYMKKYL